MQKKLSKKTKRPIRRHRLTRKPAKKKSSKKRGKNGNKKSAVRRVVKTPKKGKPIGSVTHFFGKIKVGVVRFRVSVRLGTRVHFRGATTDFAQVLSSFQYNHKPLGGAPRGKEVGVKLVKRVRQGDKIYFEE